VETVTASFSLFFSSGGAFFDALSTARVFLLCIDNFLSFSLPLSLPEISIRSFEKPYLPLGPTPAIALLSLSGLPAHSHITM